MSFLLVSSQQRLLLQQGHTQQWLAFFAAEHQRRTALLKQHRLELGSLLDRLTLRTELAAIISRHVLEIIECKLINQDKRLRLRAQQQQERQQLEHRLSPAQAAFSA